MSHGNVFSRGLSRISRRKRRRRDLPALEQGPSTPSVNTVSEAEHLTPTERPSLLGRSMDRLRRSIRQSFRRGGRRSPESSVPSELVTPNGTSGQKQEQWQPDEAAVRAGLCHFTVKYLGAVEVFESRGMQVCEGALKMLRSNRRRPIKAVLYVSGDGLRVVDQENNRGLIVDQTIEKVSFCAPDRNNDKGFAYICRDGTSRRWMCHGFHATKESGERLSHAVGCAFSICLERKKKRDEENMQNLEKSLNPNWEDKNDMHSTSQRTNQAYQSFRKQIPISDRLQDPQLAIVNTAPHSSSHQPSSSIAKPRPSSNPALFQRQGSLRAPESSSAAQFRRNYSLRQNAQSVDGFPVTHGKQSLHNEPIYEGEEECSAQQLTPFFRTQYYEGSSTTTAPVYSIASAAAPSTDMFDLIGLSANASMCPRSEVTQRSLEQDFNNLRQSAPLSVNPSYPAMKTSNTASNGFVDPSAISQVNVNTCWNVVNTASQSSSRSKADEWLEDAFRTALTVSSPSMSPAMDGVVPLANGIPNFQSTSNYSLSDASGPPPPHPPPPLPTKDVVVLEPLSARTIPVFDAFGQPIQWDPVPAASVVRSEDPFDLRWSRLAVGSAMSSNPFVAEVQRELRT